MRQILDARFVRSHDVGAELGEWLLMAHSRLYALPLKMSVAGGETDIPSDNQNRPLLTLNGHSAAVQRMAAQSQCRHLLSGSVRQLSATIEAVVRAATSATDDVRSITHS